MNFLTSVTKVSTSSCVTYGEAGVVISTSSASELASTICSSLVCSNRPVSLVTSDLANAFAEVLLANTRSCIGCRVNFWRAADRVSTGLGGWAAGAAVGF